MFKYESVIILKPNVSEEEKTRIINKVKEIVNVTETNDLGVRRLAYEAKGNKEAHYIQFFFEDEKEKTIEVEKYYRLDEKILEFMIVRIDD